MGEQSVQEIIEGMMANERLDKARRYHRKNAFVKKGQILFAGSSLMEQFPIDELQHNYAFSKVIYNRGIGGYVMRDLEEHLEECILELEPSVMFLNIGTNDLNDPNRTTEEFIANYERILDKVAERLPDLKVILMAYYPVNPEVANPWMKEVLKIRTNEKILRTNDAVKEMAARRGIGFINVNAPLYDEKGQLKAEYSVDGMHFYADGYAAIMPAMAEVIKENC